MKVDMGFFTEGFGQSFIREASSGVTFVGEGMRRRKGSLEPERCMKITR